jgi:hypothetical protein
MMVSSYRKILLPQNDENDENDHYRSKHGILWFEKKHDADEMGYGFFYHRS